MDIRTFSTTNRAKIEGWFEVAEREAGKSLDSIVVEIFVGEDQLGQASIIRDIKPRSIRPDETPMFNLARIEIRRMGPVTFELNAASGHHSSDAVGMLKSSYAHEDGNLFVRSGGWLAFGAASNGWRKYNGFRSSDFSEITGRDLRRMFEALSKNDTQPSNGIVIEFILQGRYPVTLSTVRSGEELLSRRCGRIKILPTDDGHFEITAASGMNSEKLINILRNSFAAERRELRVPSDGWLSIGAIQEGWKTTGHHLSFSDVEQLTKKEIETLFGIAGKKEPNPPQKILLRYTPQEGRLTNLKILPLSGTITHKKTIERDVVIERRNGGYKFILEPDSEDNQVWRRLERSRLAVSGKVALGPLAYADNKDKARLGGSSTNPKLQEMSRLSKSDLSLWFQIVENAAGKPVDEIIFQFSLVPSEGNILSVARVFEKGLENNDPQDGKIKISRDPASGKFSISAAGNYGVLRVLDEMRLSPAAKEGDLKIESDNAVLTRNAAQEGWISLDYVQRSIRYREAIAARGFITLPDLRTIAKFFKNVVKSLADNTPSAKNSSSLSQRQLSGGMKVGAAGIGMIELANALLTPGAEYLKLERLEEKDPAFFLAYSGAALYVPHPQTFFAEIEKDGVTSKIPFKSDYQDIKDLLHWFLLHDERAKKWPSSGGDGMTMRIFSSESMKYFNEHGGLSKWTMSYLRSSTDPEVQKRLDLMGIGR